MPDFRRNARRQDIALDRLFAVEDDVDQTKKVKFQVSGVAANTTRTVTMPDQNLNLTPGSGSYAAAGIGGVVAHAATHTNGTDDIQSATAGQKGLMTSTYASKLDGIEAAADVTDATNVAAAGAVMDGDFAAADEVMVGTGVGTHGQVTLAASQFLAKKAAGAATNVSASEARTILNVADGADVTGSNAPQAHAASHVTGGDALSGIKATQLQAAAADLGNADVIINLSNSNAGPPARVTNLTTDGTVTAGVAVSAPQLTSSVAIGTAPLGITSTTKVSNLNVDQVDGVDVGAIGGAGGVAYASGASTIAATAAGTSGQALVSGGAGAPTWGVYPVSRPAAKAIGQLQYAGAPADTGTITISDGVTPEIYEFDSGGGVTPGHISVTIGSGDATAGNLATAINTSSALVTAVADTGNDVVYITAKTAGVAGNSITLVVAATNWTSSNMMHGCAAAAAGVYTAIHQVSAEEAAATVPSVKFITPFTTILSYSIMRKVTVTGLTVWYDDNPDVSGGVLTLVKGAVSLWAAGDTIIVTVFGV